MNYFQLFNLSQQFPVDNAKLTQRYHMLQKTLHPDRFVNASDSERSEAVRYASLVNDGYQILKSPLKCAIYLLAQHGIELEVEHQTIDDEEFLMQQMLLRQQLAEQENLTGLQQQVASEIETTVATLTQQFAKEAWQLAAVETTKLQFYFKLKEQIKEKIG